MELSPTLINFFMLLLPPLFVLITAWVLIKKFLEREQKLQMIQLKMATQKDLLPLRLQAYERLTIYLERISPNVIMVNLYEPSATVIEFQSVLIESIRTEFEHNFAQQIYVSAPIWTIVRNSKEEVVRLINSAASSLDSDAPAYQLSKKVFDSMIESADFPTQRAITILKNEVSQLF